MHPLNIHYGFLHSLFAYFLGTPWLRETTASDTRYDLSQRLAFLVFLPIHTQPGGPESVIALSTCFYQNELVIVAKRQFKSPVCFCPSSTIFMTAWQQMTLKTVDKIGVFLRFTAVTAHFHRPIQLRCKSIFSQRMRFKVQWSSFANWYGCWCISFQDLQ